MKRPLRIGLLLDGYDVPAWVHLMLTRVGASPHAELAFAVLNGAGPSAPAPQSPWQRAIERVLNAACVRLMERGRCEPDALRPMDLRPMLEGLPVRAVKPERTDGSEPFSEDDLEWIGALAPDVLVRLGFGTLCGDILTVATYGVWAYHTGDPLLNRGGPPGFWESMESWPVTGTVLEILGDDAHDSVVLYRSWSMTNTRSVKLNNNARYWLAASFLPRMLDRLAAVGEQAFFEEVSRRNDGPAFYSRRLYGQPGNGELAVLLARKLRQKIARRIQARLWLDQWSLLFALRDGIATSLHAFQRIVPPGDRFWADPNVVWRDGAYRIFLEELVYAEGRGHLAVMTMDASGRWEPPVRIVEEPHHLSYPFVFEVEGELFMLAEAGTARVVPLYRCTRFPDRWVFERNLLEDVAAVDPTLLCHDGTWYLFVGVAENPGSSPLDELFVYCSDDPLSTRWTPHPLSPVVSDVRTARPAGRIFEHQGSLYRPAQNCAGRYGSGITINRIETLSRTDYRERQVGAIEPRWAPDLTGVHTLSHAHRLTMIDARLRRSRWR